MRLLAILFLCCDLAWAFPVLLLWSTPTETSYLQKIPGLLASAATEVLVAISDLRAYNDDATGPLLSALRRAKENGAQVYVLLERGQGPPAFEQQQAVELLRAWGIAVKEDSPEITMHAKFLVVDGRFVVVGSTHWTKTALTRSIQVDLLLDCPEIAQLFRSFFFHLWEGRYSTRTRLPEGTWPAPAVLPLLDFPESMGHFQALSRVLAQAREESALLVYQLAYYPQYPQSPSTQLVEALAAAAHRGRKIRVLVEGGEGSGEMADENRLSAAWLYTQGAQVRLDPVGVTMHAKALIVDGHHVLVTSANWNYSSLVKNVEAGVLFLDTPELAGLLAAKFQALWEESRPLP